MQAACRSEGGHRRRRAGRGLALRLALSSAVLLAEAAPRREEEENPFAAWFAAHRGKFAQKWSSYLEVYHRYFQGFRNRSVSLLELGVQSGGSQLMWLQYFGPRARIYGADIDGEVLRFQRPGITNFVGDVGDPVFLRSLCERIPRLDLVVDDASHVNWQQRVAFEVLYPCLNPDGGVYVVEDVDTSYKPSYGGGLRARGTFVEFAKDKIDELQAYWSCSGSTISGADGQCDRGDLQVPITSFTRFTSAIHVHDGLVVFEKTRAREPAQSVEAGDWRLPKRYIGYSGFRPVFAQELKGQGMSSSALPCEAPEPFSDALGAHAEFTRDVMGRILQQHLASISEKRHSPQFAAVCASIARLVREGLHWSSLGMDFTGVHLIRMASESAERNLSAGTPLSTFLRFLDKDVLDVLEVYFARAGTNYPLVPMDLVYRSRARDIGALRFANAGRAMELQRDGYIRFRDLGLDLDLLQAEARGALAGSGTKLTTKAVMLQSLEPLLQNHGVLELASFYMGSDVEVTGYKLLRIGEDVTLDDYISGFWHHDNCGSRLKLFIFLQDVGEDGMPTEIVRGSHNMAYFWYGPAAASRFDDGFVQSSFTVERLLSPKGGGFLFDTNTIHRGKVDGRHGQRDAVVVEIANAHKLREGVPAEGPCPEKGTYPVSGVTFPFPGRGGFRQQRRPAR